MHISHQNIKQAIILSGYMDDQLMISFQQTSNISNAWLYFTTTIAMPSPAHEVLTSADPLPTSAYLYPQLSNYHGHASPLLTITS